MSDDSKHYYPLDAPESDVARVNCPNCTKEHILYLYPTLQPLGRFPEEVVCRCGQVFALASTAAGVMVFWLPKSILKNRKNNDIEQTGGLN